ncbi:carbonic anhydrase [Polaromonas sp. P1(28)-13]|nr:carbonic anhydrase [Polaromonas sp. P1(28)-13]
MTSSIQDLFTHNRSWAAQMERDQPGFFTKLIKQQKPKYMWIGCSDSRVPANQITGLEPGEVFVHRNVANIVVHSDLNALSAIQFAVEMLKVEHIMVVGHYGCSGVQAGLEGAHRPGRQLDTPHPGCARPAPRAARAPARGAARRRVCDLNVIEQVVNVCVSTVMVDAWAKGQKVNIHGWAFGVHDGLLQDLQMTVSSTDSIEPLYRAAIEGVIAARS